jgi:uncharacterized membrane protein YkvA (DUF1232 family)
MSDEPGPDQPLREPTPLNPLRRLLRQARLVWCLLWDRRVPLWLKVIPFLSLVYLAIPADIVPDVLVGLGQLDDVAVIALGCRLFLELSPSAVVQEHLDDMIASAAGWKIVEGEAEPVDDV